MPVDPSVCPLCGAANQCAMEIEAAGGITQPPCWCAALTLGADLLARIPKASQGRACICPACAQGAMTVRPADPLDPLNPLDPLDTSVPQP